MKVGLHLACFGLLLGACASGFKPNLIGQTWQCPPEQVTSQRISSEQCESNEADEPKSNWIGALITELVVGTYVFLPERGADTMHKHGRLGFSPSCRAFYDVRGCGWQQEAICANDGRCWFNGQRDRFAASDADCAASPRCANYGECELATLHVPRGSPSFVEGKCVAASDATCAASKEACGIMGRCSMRNYRCEASWSADCARGSWCKDLGRCSAEGGKCVASTEAECRASIECTTRGRCYTRDGICVSDAPVPLGRL